MSPPSVFLSVFILCFVSVLGLTTLDKFVWQPRCTQEITKVRTNIRAEATSLFKKQLADVQVLHKAELKTLRDDNVKLTKDIIELEMTIDALRKMQTPCPSNCNNLDCREIQRVVEIAGACLDFHAQAKKILGPSP